jgi:AmmeMemoRadiSam system protein A
MERHVPLDDRDRRTLLDLAIHTIASGLDRRPVPRDVATPDSRALEALGASFVTLEVGDRLLGCIGTIEPVRPLLEDVMQNAYRSAFHDPRLPAVTRRDFEIMRVKISVLGPLQPIAAGSREELVDGLRPGVDGVLVTVAGRRATFLPSVWEKVRTADEFVDQLLRKGNVPSRPWPSGLTAARYATDDFADNGPR